MFTKNKKPGRLKKQFKFSRQFFMQFTFKQENKQTNKQTKQTNKQTNKQNISLKKFLPTNHYSQYSWTISMSIPKKLETIFQQRIWQIRSQFEFVKHFFMQYTIICNMHFMYYTFYQRTFISNVRKCVKCIKINGS